MVSTSENWLKIFKKNSRFRPKSANDFALKVKFEKAADFSSKTKKPKKPPFLGYFRLFSDFLGLLARKTNIVLRPKMLRSREVFCFVRAKFVLQVSRKFFTVYVVFFEEDLKVVLYTCNRQIQLFRDLVILHTKSRESEYLPLAL